MHSNMVLTTLLSTIEKVILIVVTIIVFACPALAQEGKNSTSFPSTPAPDTVDVTNVTVGIRKIYAPEKLVQQWPLGNMKYTYIKASDFEQQIQRWKSTLELNTPNDNNSSTLSKGYIQSARYEGQLSESGELSGTGEWVIRFNSDFSNHKPFNVGLDNFIFLSNLQIAIDNLVFTKDISDTESQDKNSSDNNSYSLLLGSLPSGNQILLVPGQGTLKFQWNAQKVDSQKYLLQSPSGLVSEWKITVPENKKIILTSLNDDRPVLSSVSAQLPPQNKENAKQVYSLRWANASNVCAEIADINEKIDNPDLQYRQETIYRFSAHQLSSIITFSFTVKNDEDFPTEIPFNAVNIPNVIWSAEFDGTPVNVLKNDSGYSVVIKNVTDGKTVNQKLVPDRTKKDVTHTLTLNTTCTIEGLLALKEQKTSPEVTQASKFSLPRIELQTGVWTSGTAVCETMQKTLGTTTNNGSVSDYTQTPQSKYVTTIELFDKQADVYMTFSPLIDQFYSQNDTVIQLDDSKISFVDSIYLWSEQGSRYVLTVPIPDYLVVDKVQLPQSSAEEEKKTIENWDIQKDSSDSRKHNLVLYLHESIRPGRALTLEIYSHSINTFSKPISIKDLQPILFEGVEPHRQSVQVNIAANQKFMIDDRVMYSPEMNSLPDPDSDLQTELPDGIVKVGTNSNDKTAQNGASFMINVKQWKNSLATIVTENQEPTVHGEINLLIGEKKVTENLNLKFSGSSFQIKEFHFDFDSTPPSSSENKSTESQTGTPWQGVLYTSDNNYRVPVTQNPDGKFVVRFPMNITKAFTLKLSRTINIDNSYQTQLLKSDDCKSLDVLTNIYTDLETPLDIEAKEIHQVITPQAKSEDTLVKQYTYTYTTMQQADKPVSPLISVAQIHNSESANKIANQKNAKTWAWTQKVDEYHFGGGSILASVEWDIENRSPLKSQSLYPVSDKKRIYWTIPDCIQQENTNINSSDATQNRNANSNQTGFITGLWIDNELIDCMEIQSEGNGRFSIPVPTNKKRFTLVIQWTTSDTALSSINHFHVQTPTIEIPIFQSSWNVYYPTSYRQLLSYQSSDPTVDGFFERLFGPLIRSESNTLNTVTQFFDSVEKSDSTITDETDVIKKLPESNTKIALQNSSNALLNSLSSPNSWNCCSFSGTEIPNKIYIIRSEVSESVRWMLFILSTCVIFSLHHLINRTNTANQNQSEDKNTSARNGNGQTSVTEIDHSKSQISRSNQKIPQTQTQIKMSVNKSALSNRKQKHGKWGFKRWLVSIAILSGLLAQILPWIFSIPFSALFISSLLCLLVLGVQNSAYNTSDKSTDSGTYSSLITGTAKSVLLSAFVTVSVFYSMSLFPSELYAAPTDSSDTETQSVPYRLKSTDTSNNYIQEQQSTSVKRPLVLNPYPQDVEYKIFVPISKDKSSDNIYCVPQELLERIQKSINSSEETPNWVICRATYRGRLVQQINKVETLYWQVAFEVETFKPNTTLELSDRIKDSIYAISDISIHRGTIQKNEQDSEDSMANPTWSWDDTIKTEPVWNDKHQSWSLRIAQPGRYLIETQFQPTIVTENNKNTISFPIVCATNSTLELTVPNTISGLEFPGAIGLPTDINNTQISDTTIPEAGQLTKKVSFGNGSQITVQWRANDNSPTNSSYEVDTLSWWHIVPEESTLKVRYNLRVQTGSVSSIRIVGDPSLTFSGIIDNIPNSNPQGNANPDKIDTQDNNIKNNNQETSDINSDTPSKNTTSLLPSATGLVDMFKSPTERSFMPTPNSGLLAKPPVISKERVSTSNSNPVLSVIQDPQQDNIYIVTFKTPVRTQTSFDLEFKYNRKTIGSPLFPNGVFPDSYSGKKLIAFTVDPRLQIDWSASVPTLVNIPIQTFINQWFSSNNRENTQADSTKTTVATSPATKVTNAPIKTSFAEVSMESLSSSAEFVPDVAYNLNLSKRKNETNSELNLIRLSVRRVAHSAYGTATSFILTLKNRFLCQTRWELVSDKGERSGYVLEFPQDVVNPQNSINIISATIRTDKRAYNASVYLNGRTLELYWGTPISGNCVVELFYELKSNAVNNNTESSSLFDFPTLQGIDVHQYKLALFRSDDVIADIHFETVTEDQVIFKTIETPVESPITDRHQQLIGTWETVSSNSPISPIPFRITVKNNDVKASVDYKITLSPENPNELVVDGTVNVEQGILDELVFQLPEYYGVPVSSKPSMVCQANTDLISKHNFYLRPLVPFTSGTEFQLVIPLKRNSQVWKIDPIHFVNVTTGTEKAILPDTLNEINIIWKRIALNDNPPEKDSSNSTVDTPKTPTEFDLQKTRYIGQIPITSQKWLHAFDIDCRIQPINEKQYYASVEFAVIHAGYKCISVTLPEKCNLIDVQTENRSVSWTYLDEKTISIPAYIQEQIYNIRIIYSATVNKKLYSEPIQIAPITILESDNTPSVNWCVKPWKKFNKQSSRYVQQRTFIQYQNRILNDLVLQMSFVESKKLSITESVLARFQNQYNILNNQIVNYFSNVQNKANNSQFKTAYKEYETMKDKYVTLLSELQQLKQTRDNAITTPNVDSIQIDNKSEDSLFDQQNDTAQDLYSFTEPGKPFILELNISPGINFGKPIWWIVGFIVVPIYIWLAFFPPMSFVPWRPTFVLTTLGLIWLTEFNLYGIGLLLLMMSLIEFLRMLRRLSRPNIVSLRVR